MAVYQKTSGSPLLYDTVTGDIVAVKDPDGSEFFFARASIFGSFFDTTTQNNPVANTKNTMTFNNTDAANTGVSMASNSKFSISRNGVYNFQISVQLNNVNTIEDDVSIWYSKGTTGSATAIVQSGFLVVAPKRHGGVDGHTVAAWNIYIPMLVGEYVEVNWSSVSTDISLRQEEIASSPTRPAVPSIILTINELT